MPSLDPGKRKGMPKFFLTPDQIHEFLYDILEQLLRIIYSIHILCESASTPLPLPLLQCVDLGFLIILPNILRREIVDLSAAP